MTKKQFNQLGQTLWDIATQLRGVMNPCLLPPREFKHG